MYSEEALKGVENMATMHMHDLVGSISSTARIKADEVGEKP